MNAGTLNRREWLMALTGSALVGCAGVPAPEPRVTVAAVNRFGWGATKAQIEGAQRLGWPAYVQQQLRADGARPLQPAVQSQIDALDISRRTPPERLLELQTLGRARELGTEAERAAGRRTYQAARHKALAEARQRHTLRALYAEQQLLEHMSWFWFNHFSVYQGSGNIFFLVPDYEDHALRPHARSRARQLPHPARCRDSPPGDAALPGQRAERRRAHQREPGA